jgi:Ca2+-binding EF-hand superfamily protein
MKLAKSMLVAAGLALAVGGAYAAGDKQAKADAEPGFNNMDKNKDGKLTRTEAAKDKSLVSKWKEADRDNDGQLSRAEYLMVKGKKDVGTATDKVKSAVGSDKKDSSAAGGTSKTK